MKKLYILLFSFYTIYYADAQISISVTTQINYVCDGNPCTYNGPKILINEVMLAPSTGDGSIYDLNNTRRGEWIELYNPDICQSIDVSCFFLGNNTPNAGPNGDIFHYGGGFVIPNGTVVPPRGFVLIRGTNAPPVPLNLLLQNGGKTIEIVVGENILNNICLGGGDRLWFPNAGGWFAFYDHNGVPQDAISWCDISNSCMSCPPCNPLDPTCGYTGALASYNDIPISKKNYITSLYPADTYGFSFRRLPDGGLWNYYSATPTYGTCNDICIPPPNITCNGMAVAVASGGQAPYTYLWNDQQATANDTVIGLCAGTYNVVVTDANNNTASLNVQIDNLQLIPAVTVSGISCNGGNNGTAEVFMNNGAPPFTYLWNTNDTTSSITNLIAGSYTISVTDTNGCHIDTVAIIPDNTVALSVSVNDTVICSGNSITLTAFPSLAGGLFQWMPGGNQTSSIIVSPLITSDYSVIYTIAGCIAMDTSTVIVNKTPKAIIHAFSNTITPEDSAIIFASGALSFLWNNGCATDTMIVKPKDDTIYCVIASNNNGCIDSTCIEIHVKGISTLYVPNAFTPNNNGLNDLFLVRYTNIEKFHIVIYNRWGNLLFETNEIDVGWDGKYCREYVPEGVYVYSIDAIGEDKVVYRKTGSLTVLR